MVLFALLAIHLFQLKQLPIASIMLGIAVNIKMSALLMVPGFMLVVAFERGLIRALLIFVVVLFV